MIVRSALTLVVLLAVTASRSPAQSPSPRVFVAVSETEVSGSLTEVGLDAPWPVTLEAAKGGPTTVVRQFGNRLFTIDRTTRTIEEFDASDLSRIASYVAGPHQTPTDLLLVNARTALVADYDGTHALWLDTLTGQFRTGPDLSRFVDGDGLPDMAMMERVGNRVYLQLQRFDRGNDTDAGALLAVFEVVSINPASREPLRLVNAIELAGRRPSFKMQADASGRRLWVCVPGGVNDGEDDTGIEEVDLVAECSAGFVIKESGFQADVGPFAMIDENKGFAVVHTSFGASTHLRVFDRRFGPPVEIHVSLGGWVDCLAFDAATRQVFYPVPATGGVSGSILVFDADTNQPLSGLLGVGGVPFDITVVR